MSPVSIPHCVLDPRRGVLPAQGRRLRGAVAGLQAVAGAARQEGEDAQGAALLPQADVRKASHDLLGIIGELNLFFPSMYEGLLVAFTVSNARSNESKLESYPLKIGILTTFTIQCAGPSCNSIK